MCRYIAVQRLSQKLVPKTPSLYCVRCTDDHRLVDNGEGDLLFPWLNLNKIFDDDDDDDETLFSQGSYFSIFC